MPYFVYKITQPTPILKNLELLETYEQYREARTYARSLRAELPANSGIIIKLMHAGSELEAEEQLHEKREKPVTKEWEK